jgi:hypothetical protein
MSVLIHCKFKLAVRHETEQGVAVILYPILFWGQAVAHQVQDDLTTPAAQSEIMSFRLRRCQPIIIRPIPEAPARTVASLPKATCFLDTCCSDEVNALFIAGQKGLTYQSFCDIHREIPLFV